MKKLEILCGRTILSAGLMIFILLGVQTAWAQKARNGKTDEQILRELIQKENEGTRAKLTEETILYSSVVPRPLIGREAVVARSQEISQSRTNEKREKQVKRLFVAKSGDLAYEFGDTVISFDAPDQTRISFTNSYLRVWRKIGGEWLVDANFARPHDKQEKTEQK